MNQKLISKIKQELNKGKNIESIKMSLLNYNYPLKEIEDAIKEIKKPQQLKKPLIHLLESKTISSYLPISSVILLIASSFLYYQTKINLSNCNSIQKGITKILGITISEGTKCDLINIRSILFLIVMILTAITTIYFIYQHFKKY